MNPIENVNPLQPSQFRFLADRRHYGNFSFFAQSVSHPGLTTNAAEAPFRQYTSVPQIPDTFTYSELQVQVLLDEELTSYIQIQDWLVSNVENEVIQPSEATSDQRSSYADLILTIQSNKNTVNKKIQYNGAFPVSIGNIDMIASQDGVPTIVFPVGFRFTNFDIS